MNEGGEVVLRSERFDLLVNIQIPLQCAASDGLDRPYRHDDQSDLDFALLRQAGLPATTLPARCPATQKYNKLKSIQ